jgi:sodium-dependent dicarboxylate transporter 2/3/5
MTDRINPKSIGFFTGLFFFSLTLLTTPPAGLTIEAWHVAGVVIMMAFWWATEAIPLPVTALLPLALFPLLQVYGPYVDGFTPKEAFTIAAKPYAHPNIYLFLGGFILALAIEKVNLHKRLALKMLLMVGTNAKYLIGGFMLISALISMWIMNTSTTLMLLPIALAIAAVVKDTTTSLDEQQFNNFQTSLLLGVAYAATIGGMATIIGTGPNVLVKSFIEDEGVKVFFFDWMLLATPISAVMLFVGWLLLTNVIFPLKIEGSDETTKSLEQMYASLGKVSTDERRVFYIFVMTALAWMSSKALVLIPFLEGLTDYAIAVFAALAIFITRSEKGTGLIDWKTTKELPWGILLLFVSFNKFGQISDSRNIAISGCQKFRKFEQKLSISHGAY